MSDAIETIDAGRIEILSEFSVEYENDEEILAPHLAVIKKVFIGTLDNMVVFSSSAANGKRTPDMAMDRANFWLLVGMLDKALKGDFDGNAEESLYVERGADKLGVGLNSNFPHGLTAPFERVYLINLRPLFLNEGDSLDQGYAGLKLPRKSAERLYAEMRKLTAEKMI